MAEPVPVLAIRGIGKAFDGTAVLAGIDLDLHPGEITALLGENGAGKSTLLNIVSGAIPPDAGTVSLAGIERRWAGPRAAIDAGIAFVHQELSVIRSLSVAENIFLGDYAARRGFVDRRRMREESSRLLTSVGAAHLDPDTPMDALRLGDQQAVEIAKALRLDLKLLLLDEPTSSLTPHEAEGLFRVVRELGRRGVAVVFISHRIEEALSLCHRIVVLRDGRLVSDRPVGETDRERILAEMAGRPVGPAAAARGQVAGDPVLTAEGLGDGHFVRDVGFTLHRGEVLGLFGLVGAGRTELLEMLYGVRPIAAGTVKLDGQPFAPRDPRQAIAAGLALVPEGRKANGILPNRPVAENILVTVLGKLARGILLDRRQERACVAEAVQRLGIVLRSPAQPIRTLSGGNQQKCLLARCLATNPRVLLLDEPTHGVDVRTKAQLYAIVRELAAAGTSIVIASSEMLELFAVADRVLVLSNGRQSALVAARDTEPVALMRAAFRYVEEPAAA